MKLAFEILSSLTTVIGIFQKQKWKMMLWYTISNILTAIMYLAFSRYATMAICFVAAIRTIVYMVYAIKKLKPNWIWLIIFESVFILTTVFTWQDALDLMPLFAMLLAGYGSWQDNQLVLRICYILNNSLYVAYKLIISAYISMSISIICLISTIFCLFYYCVFKKQTPVLEIIFKKRKQQDYCTSTENMTEVNGVVAQQNVITENDADTKN